MKSRELSQTKEEVWKRPAYKILEVKGGLRCSEKVQPPYWERAALLYEMEIVLRVSQFLLRG